MFSAVLKEFFVADSQDNISQQLLKLELLAENFGEALSLRPLFLDLQRNIQGGTSPRGPSRATADPTHG